MQKIDLEPRAHSHLYEVKPMSRWWLALAVAYALVCLFALGFNNVLAYACIFAGVLLALAIISVFPNFWLSRIKD